MSSAPPQIFYPSNANQQALYIPKEGAINVETIHSEIEQINDEMFRLLSRAEDTLANIDAKVNDDARAAELLVSPQKTVLPLLNDDGTLKLDENGRPLEPGKPGGRLEPVTDEQYDRLTKRVDLLRRLIAMVKTPQGNATYSYAQLARMAQQRWGV